MRISPVSARSGLVEAGYQPLLRFLVGYFIIGGMLPVPALIPVVFLPGRFRVAKKITSWGGRGVMVHGCGSMQEWA
jgi:hypothetical protein